LVTSPTLDEPIKGMSVAKGFTLSHLVRKLGDHDRNGLLNPRFAVGFPTQERGAAVRGTVSPPYNSA
jgi:hypothetical protein